MKVVTLNASTVVSFNALLKIKIVLFNRTGNGLLRPRLGHGFVVINSIFHMKTSRIQETCNTEFILNIIFFLKLELNSVHKPLAALSS